MISFANPPTHVSSPWARESVKVQLVATHIVQMPAYPQYEINVGIWIWVWVLKGSADQFTHSFSVADLGDLKYINIICSPTRKDVFIRVFSLTYYVSICRKLTLKWAKIGPCSARLTQKYTNPPFHCTKTKTILQGEVIWRIVAGGCRNIVASLWMGTLSKHLDKRWI